MGPAAAECRTTGSRITLARILLCPRSPSKRRAAHRAAGKATTIDWACGPGCVCVRLRNGSATCRGVFRAAACCVPHATRAAMSSARNGCKRDALLDTSRIAGSSNASAPRRPGMTGIRRHGCFLSINSIDAARRRAESLCSEPRCPHGISASARCLTSYAGILAVSYLWTLFSAFVGGGHSKVTRDTLPRYACIEIPHGRRFHCLDTLSLEQA
jgi:hypothetical protein